MLEAKRSEGFDVIETIFEPGDSTRYEYILIVSHDRIMFGQGFNGKYKLMTINSLNYVSPDYIMEKLDIDPEDRGGYDAYMASWFIRKYGKQLSDMESHKIKISHEQTDAENAEMLEYFDTLNFKTFMHVEGNEG